MSSNQPPLNPPPHPSHVHVHRELPGPSPYVVVPLSPNTLRGERDELERNYWRADQRPWYALVTALLNLGLVTLAVFKAISAINKFETEHWLSGLLFVFTVANFIGAFIFMFIASTVMAAMGGVCRLLTGKSLFPGETRHGQTLDDPVKDLVGMAGVVGMFLAEAIWIIAGLVR
jgi:hypothetical protein